MPCIKWDNEDCKYKLPLIDLVLVTGACPSLDATGAEQQCAGRLYTPRDALKKDSRGLSRGAAGNPRFPRLLPGTLENFPGCL